MKLATTTTLILALSAAPVFARPHPVVRQARAQKKAQKIVQRPYIQQRRAEMGWPALTTAANVSGLASGIPIGLGFSLLKRVMQRNRDVQGSCNSGQRR